MAEARTMPAPLPALAAEALSCLRFYTRVPLPSLAVEAVHPPEPFARCLRWAPMAGAVVGLVGGGVLAGAAAAGLPPSVSATLALLGTVLAGGGLHEDGLADVADGFGGGHTRERKLAIMRDSRIGSYGALAIGFSLALRIGCVSALLDHDGVGAAVVGLVTAAAASRGLGLMPMALLASARADGLGHAAGRLPAPVFPTAATLATAVALGAPALAGFGTARSALALVLSAMAAAGMTEIARRQIGGYTGDVAGACQQLCEAALLVGLLMGPT